MTLIANQSLGRFKTGDKVTGLTLEREKQLLEAGVIEKSGSAEQDSGLTDVSKLKVAELKQVLDQKGIEYPADAKKDELISLLPSN